MHESTAPPAADELPPSPLLRVCAWITLLASAAALLWSYTLPTVEFEALLSETEIYSIYGGIEMLWLDGSPILAAIVFLFSIIYPVGKLLALVVVAWSAQPGHGRRRTVHWLELLGKWSMLDVFVIGAFVGSIRLQLGENVRLARAESLPGIDVFCGAILLSMIATVLVGRLVQREHPRTLHPLCDDRHPLGRLFTTAAAIALGIALAQPIVQVSKTLLFVTFSNQVSLPDTTRAMAHNNELLLAGTLALFVIGTSVARSLVVLRIRWLGKSGPATLRLALGLEEWAMLDVFALGMVIVWVKLDELADATLLDGFWWMLVAAALGTLDAWALRRDARAAATASTATRTQAESRG